MPNDELTVHSWEVQSNLYGPSEFQMRMVLPTTGISWSMVSSGELARTVYEFCHERTLPRWRRVMNALRGI